MKTRNYLFIKSGEAVFVFTILLLCLAFKSHGQVQPSKIFSNGMVLQRDVNIFVWGTGTSGATVTVSLSGENAETTVSENGKWKVSLPAMEAGGPFQMEITSGTKSNTYSDVYIGDVWVASGQSNMEMTVSQSDSAATEIAAANNQMIRQFKIPKTLANEPSDIVPTASIWTAATRGNVGNFTAAGYYFAKALYKELNIPIGIINTSYGGSRIEAWMSEELLGYDEEDVILQEGIYQERQPTKCYNQMLKPMEGLPVKGFIWYQGESNADDMEDAVEYGQLFKKMITGWRDAWGMGNLPFIWVQLPNFGEKYTEPNVWDAWPVLRQNQTLALSLPNTGEAVAIDLGDTDIHPTHKQEVGQRMALVARKIAYNQEIVYSGPRYNSHKITNDGKVIIAFDHVADGLVAKNSEKNEIQGFAISDSNGLLRWAQAIVRNDSVIVWSENVATPTVIRYAWEYNPTCYLYNSAGLPAAPFKINLNEIGFAISSFKISASELERGQNALLTWETSGANSAKLNGEMVETTSGKRIFPQETSSYTLVVTNENGDSISETITVTVVDPKPTIVMTTDVGGIASPGTEITLKASTTAPKGRTIKQVDFYINNEKIGTDTESPFEVKWTPAEVGEYSLTGIVTDNTDITVTSEVSVIYVTKMKMIYYEAENASWTGTASVKSSNQANGKKYLDLQSGWVLTFDNVEAPETGSYPLTVRYLLNYESPKAQTLIVNGKSLGDITFTAPNTSTWMTYVQNIDLNKGTNTVVFDGSWEWMSFDYIAIAVEDTSTVGNNTLNNNILDLKSFPNPVTETGTIAYSVPEDGKISIEIVAADGKVIEKLLDETKKAGDYVLEINCAHLQSGIYLMRLQTEASLLTKRFVIKR